MKMYGNNHTRMTGIIRDVQKKNALVEFTDKNRQIFIPKSFIHSPLEINPTKQQEIEIDTWYLMRNRIIPPE